MGGGAIFCRFLTINPQVGAKNHATASAVEVKAAEFRCYLRDGNRQVMAIETIRALALPRALTKGILAAVARQAATFELWRNNLCVYTYELPNPSPARTPPASLANQHDAADH